MVFCLFITHAQIARRVPPIRCLTLSMVNDCIDLSQRSVFIALFGFCVLGLSVNGCKVKLSDFCTNSLFNGTEAETQHRNGTDRFRFSRPVVFVIGAVAKSDPGMCAMLFV